MKYEKFLQDFIDGKYEYEVQVEMDTDTTPPIISTTVISVVLGGKLSGVSFCLHSENKLFTENKSAFLYKGKIVFYKHTIGNNIDIKKGDTPPKKIIDNELRYLLTFGDNRYEDTKYVLGEDKYFKYIQPYFQKVTYALATNTPSLLPKDKREEDIVTKLIQAAVTMENLKRL